MLALAAPLGVPAPARAPLPEYQPSPQSNAFAARWLAERRLEEGRFVVLGLGARRAARQPSKAQILRWSNRWHRDQGLQTVLTWTPGRGSRLYPGDDDLAASVLAARRSDIHPFKGELTNLLGVIWRARVSVFPDSGLMHFAAASPGGVMGLFAASKAPEQWGPRGNRARWLVSHPTVEALGDDRLFDALDDFLLPQASSTATTPQ
jgi:heptosyltransferase III